MPLLVIPIIIGFVCVAVGAGGGVVFGKWDDIQYTLKGKKIAVLGERKVGKTTFLTYMEKGILIERYKQTLDKPEKVEKTRVELGDLDIRLKKTDDVPGSQYAYGVWKTLFDSSDVILYMVRTDRLLKHYKNTEKRCKDDLKQIQGWIKDSKSKKQLFIVGNHWDTDPKYKNLTPETMGDYVDRFRALPIVKKMTQLAGGAATVKVALGSLATENDADTLIKTIFTQIKK